jgi:16S rRNA (guanine966-N2)-methyltransferase
MRIIAGKYRSRPLRSLRGMDIRPTSDRLRETLFNVLTAGNPAALEGTIWLDIFAGTGAVGIEALSRGAAKAIFVEQNFSAAKTIRENLRTLGIEAHAEVRQGRATAMIPRIEAEIVFLDPPYALENEYTAALELLGEKAPALVIAQHPSRLKLAERYGALHRTRLLKQGDNALSFYATD